MSALRGDFETKIVVELVVEPTSGRILRGDEIGHVRARGTRQNFPLRPPPLASGTGTIAAQRPPPEDPVPTPPPVRDPVAVLRTYPVSTLDRQDPAALPRQTLRASSPGPHLDNKIQLAHLALDLYRELESTREAASTCADRRCQARTQALRGALVEACLLVQRVAMMSPDLPRHDDIIERLRDLLAMIEP